MVLRTNISFPFYLFLLQGMTFCITELSSSECWSVYWQLYIDLSQEFSEPRECLCFLITQCIVWYLGNLILSFFKNDKILEFPLCHDCRSFAWWKHCIKLTWKNCMKTLKMSKGSVVSVPSVTWPSQTKSVVIWFWRYEFNLWWIYAKDCLMTFSHK